MRLALLASVILLGASSPAFAHKLIVDPRPEGDRLLVEAFYEDETPAQQAKITVMLGDTVVAEGRTDEKGVWSCPKPMPGTYLVKAESLGHAAKESVVIEVSYTTGGDSTADEDRAEKTRTPWNRIGLGLGLIIGITLMSLVLRKNRPKNTPRND